MDFWQSLWGGCYSPRYLGRVRTTAATIRSQTIKRKVIMETYEKNITIKGLIDAYGKERAQIIIEHGIRNTIMKTQRKMRGGNPLFNVLLKDPITGKLVIDTDHVLKLQYIGKDGKRRDLFTESEIHAMARIMPGFDHYYEVRRAGYDNE